MINVERNKVLKRADASVVALVAEYEALVEPECVGKCSSRAADWASVIRVLRESGAWTKSGAEHLVDLVRQNGSFVLRNALALALAFDIEDGELGL